MSDVYAYCSVIVICCILVCVSYFIGLRYTEHQKILRIRENKKLDQVIKEMELQHEIDLEKLNMQQSNDFGELGKLIPYILPVLSPSASDASGEVQTDEKTDEEKVSEKRIEPEKKENEFSEWIKSDSGNSFFLKNKKLIEKM